MRNLELLPVQRNRLNVCTVPKWRNWQTRVVQVHVLARVWGFESLLRHQKSYEPCLANRPRRAFAFSDCVAHASCTDSVSAMHREGFTLALLYTCYLQVNIALEPHTLCGASALNWTNARCWAGG